MALINLKDLLNHAKEHKYAVGAFNMTNIDFIDTVVGAAVEQNSPLILQLAEVHFRYLNLEHIAPAIIRAASEVQAYPFVSILTMAKNLRPSSGRSGQDLHQ
jgi:fructose-bisphosphate aldolase, class II